MTNLYEIHAREKEGLPENWKIYRFACMPPASKETLYLEFTGAVAPVKKRGKNAGHTNWRKMDRATRKTVIITPNEHEEWKRNWEKKTGKCSECVGEGQVMESWDHLNGVRNRPCGKCKGTGQLSHPTDNKQDERSGR